MDCVCGVQHRIVSQPKLTPLDFEPVLVDWVVPEIGVDSGLAGAGPSGGMWEAMHGTMRGYYEARTRGPDRRLYRLFCILEREAPGLARPSIVVIAGLSKAHGRVFSEAEYSLVSRLGDEYRRRTPRNVV